LDANEKHLLKTCADADQSQTDYSAVLLQNSHIKAQVFHWPIKTPVNSLTHPIPACTWLNSGKLQSLGSLNQLLLHSWQHSSIYSIF